MPYIAVGLLTGIVITGAIAVLALFSEEAVAGRNGLPGRRVGGGSRFTGTIEQCHFPATNPQDHSDEPRLP